jgi:hypothetical protein
MAPLMQQGRAVQLLPQQLQQARHLPPGLLPLQRGLLGQGLLTQQGLRSASAGQGPPSALLPAEDLRVRAALACERCGLLLKHASSGECHLLMT